MFNIIKQNKYMLLMFTISMASFMVNLDTYVVNVSLPFIARDFVTDTTGISWVVHSYNLMVVSLLLVFGKLGDKIGLKKLFILGFIIFTVSSLLCGISNSLFLLIFSRFIQGIGASVLYALPQAMISKYLPKEKRRMAFGILASAAALGITLGAPVSGIITGILSWRWIFFINIPVGIFAVYFLLKCLPLDFLNFTGKKPFDFLGAFLSFLFALTFTVFLNQGKSFGWHSMLTLSTVLVSMAALILFIIRIKSYKYPLLEVKLFKDYNFVYANFAMFFVSALLSGTSFLMPFYLSEMKNFSVTLVGFVLMIYSFSYMLTGIVSGKISKNIKNNSISLVSMIIYLFNILFFIKTLNSENIIFIILFLIFSGISFSLFITSNNNLVMSMPNKKDVGMVAGIHRTVGRFGMLFGVVVFESIFAASSNINLTEAFKNAYIFGATVCIFTMIFLSFIKELRCSYKD